MKERSQAMKIVEKCQMAGAARITKVTQKEKSEKAPLPYDLTSLQRDANRMLGYTAQQTLDYTQSLYEKKLVTYPRTDSRYLTEDMKDMLPGLVQKIRTETGIAADQSFSAQAKQIINGAKVSDHHAIIPTNSIQGNAIAELPSGEKAIFQLIATRLICSVGEPFRYTETAVEMECARVEGNSGVRLSSKKRKNRGTGYHSGGNRGHGSLSY